MLWKKEVNLDITDEMLCETFMSLHPKDIDQGALKQIGNLRRLPFAQRLAIMPDVHQGYGMPIGGVLGTSVDVVIPNAVGVDIGCLDKDTEVLTQSGWEKISAWSGSDILQYDKVTDSTKFIQPTRYIIKDCPEFYELKTSYGLDQRLSPDHKMLMWVGYRGRGYTIKDYYADDFVKKHNSLKKGLHAGVKTVFNYDSDAALDMSDSEIRVQIMVAADGCLRKRKTVPDKVEVHIRKKRKIDRAAILLDDAGIEFTKYDHADGTVTYLFVSPRQDKRLNMFWGASSHQLGILAEECLLWDGHTGCHSNYHTSCADDANVVQFAFAVSGVRANISRVDYDNLPWKSTYTVYKTRNTIVTAGTDRIGRVPSEDGKAYCFTVPTGYFVARRNNYIFITGNCGMQAVQTDIHAEYLNHDQLVELSERIRSLVPLGFNVHKTPIQRMPTMGLTGAVSQQAFERARVSIGTLGGGNHFIEVQKGDDDHLWLMVHCGSRNLGKQVADHYNKIAKGLNKTWYSKVEPDIDLAFLQADQADYGCYINDMQYCIEFAKINRSVIMDAILTSLNKVLGSTTKERLCGKRIDICHNHARKEHHLGKNMMVHRKGAAGPLRPKGKSIIPGSQGTSSFIVSSKDTTEMRLAMATTSHGAGRPRSRSDSKRQLDVQAQEALMSDIVHGKLSTKNLDEAPGAYKDIHKVMEDQAELCNVEVQLTPLVNIKG